MTQSSRPQFGTVKNAIRDPSGDTDPGPALSMSFRGLVPSDESF
jgi:hypothetical protein